MLVVKGASMQAHVVSECVDCRRYEHARPCRRILDVDVRKQASPENTLTLHSAKVSSKLNAWLFALLNQQSFLICWLQPPLSIYLRGKGLETPGNRIIQDPLISSFLRKCALEKNLRHGIDQWLIGT